jgi:hypothetical protein
MAEFNKSLRTSPDYSSSRRARTVARHTNPPRQLGFFVLRNEVEGHFPRGRSFLCDHTVQYCANTVEATNTKNPR